MSRARPFELLLGRVLAEGRAKGLRKLDGHIYEPWGHCSFRVLEPYGSFLNRVLRGDAVYTSNPRLHDALVRFLSTRDDDGLPNLVVDRGVLEFGNGVLLLRTLEFVRADVATSGKAARHRIPGALDVDALDTPLLDRMLRHQMSDESYAFLRVMIGRLFFAVDELDDWQVTPFLYGVSGTGKSVLLHVVAAMFSPSAVAILRDPNDPFRGKELVMTHGAPRALRPCSLPAVCAGNHLPVCKGVRLLLFTFRTPVASAAIDTWLAERIKEGELAAFAYKCIRAYVDAVRTHGMGDVARWCPQG